MRLREHAEYDQPRKVSHHVADLYSMSTRGATPPALLFLGFLRRDGERPRAADVVFEQLEAHRRSYLEIIEVHAVFDVAAVEVDLAVVAKTDEAMSLADQNLRDPARGGFAA